MANHSRPRLSLLLLVIAACANASPANAQGWTVTILHPADARDSDATGVFRDTQVGVVNAATPGVVLASRWSGTAASWTNINPPGVTNARVSDMDGAIIGGNTNRACFWNGSLFTSLDGADSARLYGVGSGWQAGSYQVGTINVSTHAAIWHGSTASRIDLHPSGASSSIAMDVWGGQQVGSVSYSGGSTGSTIHAAFWNGTHSSFIDLHPPGSAPSTTSTAYAVHRGRQCGVASNHAGYWTGSAASWVDLHPSGFLVSGASSLFGPYTAGYVTTVGTIQSRAALWSGTTFINLHETLPPQYANSTASGVWYDATRVCVVGTAYNLPLDRSEAVMWTRTHCPADLDNDANLSNGATLDDAVDINDLIFFLQAFEAGSPFADLDNDSDPIQSETDGAITIEDLLYFLSLFEAGC